MKLKGAKQVHYDSGPNMTPLVDVVMVILIFLMLAGSFSGAEHFLVSNLPLSQSGAGGAPIPAGFIPDEPLDIRVDSPTPDRFVARYGQYQVDNIEALSQILATSRETYNKEGTPTEKLQIVISPGKNVKYKFLIDVYEAALNAKFTKVAFGTAR